MKQQGAISDSSDEVLIEGTARGKGKRRESSTVGDIIHAAATGTLSRRFYPSPSRSDDGQFRRTSTFAIISSPSSASARQSSIPTGSDPYGERRLILRLGRRNATTKKIKQQRSFSRPSCRSDSDRPTR